MRFHYNILLLIIIACALVHTNCNRDFNNYNKGSFGADSILVASYLSRADSIKNAEFTTPLTYAKAIVVYDSALQMAQISNHPQLLGLAYNGLGLAYESWNQDTRKTISYLQQAIWHLKKAGMTPYQEKYARFLLAHALSKQSKYNESALHLDTLCSEIKNLSDDVKKQMDFSVLIARTYAIGQKYEAAENCLNDLTKRQWIANNPKSYFFLNHYYLIKAQIDVMHRNNFNSVYLDSTYLAFNTSTHVGDMKFLGAYLRDLHRYMKHDSMVNSIEKTMHTRVDVLTTKPDDDLKAAKLIGEVEDHRKQNEIESKSIEIKSYKILLVVITFLAIAVGLLAFRLMRSNKTVNAQKTQLNTNLYELEHRNEEIELLHKEMHHRIKNNLQMMQSLMLMQEVKSGDEAVANIMREMRARINSISNLHMQLLEHNQQVNLNQYVKELVKNVVNISGQNNTLHTELAIDDIALPQKHIYAIGLILNEWLTNSAKYSASAEAPNEVTCYLSIKNFAQDIMIDYYDTGTPTSTPSNHSGMGTQIVKLLVSQINGTLTRNFNNHYHYYLQIPKP